MRKIREKRSVAGIHPLIKIASVLSTLVLVILRPGFNGGLWVYFFWLFILLILWFIEGLNLKISRGPILIGLAISLLLILTQGFLYRDPISFTPLFDLFQTDISGRNIGTFTLEGLIAGSIGSLKIFCILISTQILITNTEIDAFSYSLLKLKIPDTFVFVLVTGMRFTKLIEQAWNDIMDSNRLRGIDVDNIGVIYKITNLYPRIIVPLILSLFRIGLHLEIAITTRGFKTTRQKTLYYELKMEVLDYLLLILVIVFLFFEIFLLFVVF